jgi:DNA polymerase bacteriophage-type
MGQALYVFKERTLFSDTESYGPNDLKKCGLYKYWEDAEIILLAYAFDNDPVTVIDVLQGEVIPQEFIDGLLNPAVIKRAFNAAFERQAYYKHLDIYCDPEEWRCTMVLGTSLGLPASLAMQCRVLNMPLQKLSDIGKDGIKTFCVPVKKPLKKHGYRTRNLPKHFPEKWEGFKVYNKRDVESERELYCRLAKYDQACLWPAWALDQRINDRGVMIDLELVNQAIRMNDIIKGELTEEARRITGLRNPNSVQQLIDWLNKSEEEEDKQRALLQDEGEEEVDIEAKITDLRKKTVIELLGTVKSPVSVRVLQLRQLMAKSSLSKYRAMQRSVCRDGRIRGLLQFYGAARTGRWAGRIVQVQNLPQNHYVDLELLRSLVKGGDLATLKLLFGEGILQVLSELIRTAFVPAPGKRFIIVDFSSIEARLTAWDAQEEWRLEVFRTHGLLYEASASRMFKVPMHLIKKGGPRSELRPKGKVTELACSYQGSVNALKNMGALEGPDAMQEHELLPAVRLWRAESPKVVQNWYNTQDDAMEAIKYKRTVRRERYGFEYRNNTLFQVLPSGRKLAYPHARLEFDKKFGRDAIVFDGIDQYTHQWKTIKTYGGRVFQNRNQANGVDNLIAPMLKMDRQGIDIVFSVHDEPVLEVDEDWMSELYAPDHENKAERKKSKGVKYVERLMCEPQPGFPGLPLAADGMDAVFYQK